ncbi:isochorismate synthase [Pusillimonas sp. SM2304]|uniref:isochorismate synthase n=1 Tax=Pusillimonas sp. SM2304 TaxID=3073241 RepID=UPI0028750D7A|nr:isochorismate synthase [Pusillimonas sp. SM2304]MDS1140758.1 isochorismate synthase [Pusillimonas sp. SM2304]
MTMESGASAGHKHNQEHPASSGDAWLLDGFEAGDFFFASPTTQYRGWSKDGVLSAYQPADSAIVQSLFDQAAQRGISEPMLFGLVPFDMTKQASMAIPVHWDSAGIPSKATGATPANKARPRVVKREPVPAPEQYGDMVRAALGLFAQGELKKVVLSRAMDVLLDRPLDYAQLLPDLLSRNAKGYTFAVPIWGDGADAPPTGVMVGASPELLVRRTGDRIVVNPLAGSIGRNSDPEKDQALKEGLACSEKDLREHGYVVADIERILRSYCDELDMPDGPSVIGTDTLWHLSTYITGRLRNPAITALELSCALHPTPAICGHPTAAAFNHIRTLEPFDRGYFAGLVGWQHANGDGEWALALRCALHTGDSQLRLYAGAGTVAGSDPDSEIRETATKMETFMRAIS